MAESQTRQENSSKNLVHQSWEEWKKMWEIAGPSILTSVLQNSIVLVSTVFVGHLGVLELASLSVAILVIETFAYGVLLGMGSALETLCGQAVGAGQLDMLGVLLQRSCIITLSTALILTPTFIFTTSILKFLRQSHAIANLAGQYTMLATPQLFFFALNFPLQKFFQSQSRVWVMTTISFVSLLLHTLFCWVFVNKLGLRLKGAAIAGDLTWLVIDLAQGFYLTCGCFPDSWKGFSILAFQSLSGFIKLSLSSAVMLCLETWYYTTIILLVGYLKNPEIAVDAVSNTQIVVTLFCLGFILCSCSVRVSNELGAGHPEAAKRSVVVAVTTSAIMGIIFMSLILITRNDFPKLFTGKTVVVKETSKLGTLLALAMLLNTIQPVLSGVAIGAGWQALVAYINIGCYYAFGLPIGGVLGYTFKLGAMGIWSGMLSGTLLQTVILVFITARTSWEKEAMKAEERIQTWGG
ncbi:Multi antimicrobial extrusion protein [Macleaya cordata]|uniref:Protein DETOXIFICATION n=1 Tax=Macleaya cordata TaxID=56857 RepID=A0A200Q279_MACCD|nr:Multi antimicrobial extrusion protein [Macleaya cordata]